MNETFRHGGEIYDKNIELDYSVNLNPLGLPKSVKEALISDLTYVLRYPDTECRALREGLSAKLGPPPETILCGNGASELFQLIVRAAAPKTALVEAPTFSGYEKALRDGGVIPGYYVLDKENDFALTEDFLPALEKKPDMVFLCQPNNPVGNTIDRALLKKIAEKCRENKILLVVDECFLELVPGYEDLTVKPLIPGNPFLIVVSAFTKVYAMPGLRLGFLITSNQELLGRMKDSQTEWSVSSAAQTAGAAALQEEAYVREAVALIGKERACLASELGRRGFRVYPGEANYLMFEVTEPLRQKLPGEDLADRLLEKGILIRKCSNYHGLDESFFRIAVKCHEDNLCFIKKLDDVLCEV